MSFAAGPVVIRIHSVGPGPGPNAEQRMMLAMHFINSGLAENMARAFASQHPPAPPVAAPEVIENLPEVTMTRHKCDGHCVVCQEKFQCGDNVTGLPCEHRFHRKCVVPWLESHNTCPICRFELPEAEPKEPEKVETEETENEETDGPPHIHHFPAGMRMLPGIPRGIHPLPSHFPVPHSIIQAAAAAFEAMAERRESAIAQRERAGVRARPAEDSEPEPVEEESHSEESGTRSRRRKRRRIRSESDASTSSESSESASSSSSSSSSDATS